MNDSHPENQVEESTHYLELMGELREVFHVHGEHVIIFLFGGDCLRVAWRVGCRKGEQREPSSFLLFLNPLFSFRSSKSFPHPGLASFLFWTSWK